MPDAIDWIVIGLMGVDLIAGIALVWAVRSERAMIRGIRRHFVVDFQTPKFTN